MNEFLVKFFTITRLVLIGVGVVYMIYVAI